MKKFLQNIVKLKKISTIALLHNFGCCYIILMRHNKNQDLNEQFNITTILLANTKIDKKHSYAIFPYKNNNHICYDYSEINQKDPPVQCPL
jgi:D-alanyl-lipoteichoic acid acyltransferase DltB (MBOAT superfamily)